MLVAKYFATAMPIGAAPYLVSTQKRVGIFLFQLTTDVMGRDS